MDMPLRLIAEAAFFWPGDLQAVLLMVVAGKLAIDKMCLALWA
ncbi:hypothetical protein [Janthinobacterium psychrotolerans]|nr:hypothetical protein [Janthinobacterium psychrotolerans]